LQRRCLNRIGCWRRGSAAAPGSACSRRVAGMEWAADGWWSRLLAPESGSCSSSPSPTSSSSNRYATPAPHLLLPLLHVAV
jgi:hypothetical protein